MDKKSVKKPAILDGQPVHTSSWPVWPFITEDDIKNVASVLKGTRWTRSLYSALSKDSRVVQFENKFAETTNTQYAVACTSGTAAIELALKAAGLNPGSEVIVPAYTFIATASAVIQVGGLPVFADVEPNTYNIDVKSVEKLINENTEAIVGVHMAGRPFDVDAMKSLAEKHQLIFIEDCAQAIGATWKGKSVGSFGHVGTYSLQNSKNLAAGEGGAVVTNDEETFKMAYSMHNNGRTLDGVFYEHYNASWNIRMTEMQAAILLGQLQRLDEQTRIRNENGKYLSELLSKIDGIYVPPHDDRITMHGYHLYLFQINSENFGLDRDDFLKALNMENIPAGVGYPIPLYKNPLFQQKNFGINGYIEGKTVEYKDVYCPVTEELIEKTIAIPQNVLLGTKEDMECIAEGIKRIKEYATEIKKNI